MIRKPVQVVTFAAEHEGFYEIVDTVLANDGTIWRRNGDFTAGNVGVMGKWRQCAELPQPDPEKPGELAMKLAGSGIAQITCPKCQVRQFVNLNGRGLDFVPYCTSCGQPMEGWGE